MNMRSFFSLVVLLIMSCSFTNAMHDLQKTKALIVLMQNQHISGQTDEELMNTYKCDKVIMDECRDILNLQQELLKKDTIENEKEKIRLVTFYLKNTHQDERGAVCELMKTVSLGESLIEAACKQLEQKEQPVFFIGDQHEKLKNSMYDEIDLNAIEITAPLDNGSQDKGSITEIVRRIKDPAVLKQEDIEELTEIAQEEWNERILQQVLLESKYNDKK